MSSARIYYRFADINENILERRLGLAEYYMAHWSLVNKTWQGWADVIASIQHIQKFYTQPTLTIYKVQPEAQPRECSWYLGGESWHEDPGVICGKPIYAADLCRAHLLEYLKWLENEED